MKIYEIDKIGSEMVLVNYNDNQEVITVAVEKMFHEGDLVYFRNGEMLLVDVFPLIIANYTIRELIDNGNIKPSKLDSQKQEKYDEAVKTIEEYLKNPRLLNTEETYSFLKNREQMFEKDLKTL